MSFRLTLLGLRQAPGRSVTFCRHDRPCRRLRWKSGVAFSRLSVDDDVRSVLRAILAADGLSVFFKPGVEGRPWFNFREVPLQAAFEQVLGEAGLHAHS